MDIRHIKYFLRLYMDRNISKASENLFLSQQGLSKVIKKLEEELGVPLFVRTTSGVEPTSYGEILKNHAASIIEEYDEMVGEFRREQEQHVGRLYITMALGMISLLSPKPFVIFSETYPNIDFVFHEHRDPKSDVLLLEGNADLGCTVSPVDTNKFDSFPIFPLQGFVLVNKKHRFAKLPEVTADDLRGERLVLCGSPAYYAFTGACRENGFEPNVVLSSTDFNMSLIYVQSGFGICPTFERIPISIKCPEDIVIVPFRSQYTWEVCLISKKGAFSDIRRQTIRGLHAKILRKKCIS